LFWGVWVFRHLASHQCLCSRIEASTPLSTTGPPNHPKHPPPAANETLTRLTAAIQNDSPSLLAAPLKALFKSPSVGIAAPRRIDAPAPAAHSASATATAAAASPTTYLLPIAAPGGASPSLLVDGKRQRTGPTTPGKPDARVQRAVADPKSWPRAAVNDAAWRAAKACLGHVATEQRISDGYGRLWGWESDVPCAFKDARGVPFRIVNPAAGSA